MKQRFTSHNPATLARHPPPGAASRQEQHPTISLAHYTQAARGR
jgi:hypothetical protein